ncbi:hypothetical protein [Curtobacterium aurantiacum]|uniref:hypothetical protein n=1 Tax=Curtobacterium aurantiacum TaxID=3236919 RepID=UPI001BDE212A|nr:hypothetical protein [Curtobacterium flaccumfaciens]MBT1678253.1 hypothetical protein [Curtobacterium flaccumfaciens pv. flaccumfaciens]
MSRSARAAVLAIGAVFAVAGIALVGVAWFALPADDPAVSTLTVGAFPVIGLGTVALLVVVASDRRRRN